jgi:hypothetical protein
MATLMPDPTFYPSPKMAMRAPEEKLAYVVLLNPEGNGRTDALAVMAAVALVVYDRLGLMILKRTWFNVDLLWAGTLVGAGVITLLI